MSSPNASTASLADNGYREYRLEKILLFKLIFSKSQIVCLLYLQHSE